MHLGHVKAKSKNIISFKQGHAYKQIPQCYTRNCCPKCLTWKLIEISISVLLPISIVPEVSRHAWKRLNTHKFPAQATYWLACIHTNTQCYYGWMAGLSSMVLLTQFWSYHTFNTNRSFQRYSSQPISWLGTENKKLSYRRVTARCVLSVVIMPITTQQCRNYLYDKS